ncbi:hypothetical protein KC352_g43059, partial [Hortaea werneckii]
MTFFHFTGRATLRRLHQAVQRNILQQHQKRYGSSKEPFTRNQNTTQGKQQSKQWWTIPGPGWAWIEPLAAPLRGYGNMQRRSPILTQLESTL